MGPLQLLLFQAARGFWESCSGVTGVMALWNRTWHLQCGVQGVLLSLTETGMNSPELRKSLFAVRRSQHCVVQCLLWSLAALGDLHH